MKRLCFILLLIIAAVRSSAQTYAEGTVYDQDMKPLAGAAVVLVSDRSKGCVTDIEGRYRLELPGYGKHLLEASFLGFAITSAEASASGETDFILHPDSQMMDMVVVTGTRTPRLLKDVPIVTRVITADDIRTADATHIGDLLQSELPGIEFSYSMDQQVSLNMSGFGGNSVLFLVDGERVAGETLDNIDYSRLNLENIERIEIVKGAASSLYGSNAIGGVVNIISKTQTEPWSVDLNARYGAHNDQRYGLSAGFIAGRVRSTADIQYTSTAPIDLSEGTGNPEVGDYSLIYGNRTWNFKERLTVSATDRLELTARAGYFFRERDASESLKDRYRSFSSGIKGKYTFSEASALEAAWSFDQYDKSNFLTSARSDIRDYSNVQNIARVLYNHTFAGRHILTAGGDYMRDYLMSYQFEEQGSHIQHTADAFVQFDWNPHERFNMIGGLRFDWFSQTSLKHISPKIGIMYKIKDCSLRGSYAGGFRAPSLKEMFMNFYMGNIFMIYGNENLRPEISHNFTLSAEYMKRNWNVTVSGFYNLVDNRITTAWNSAMNGMVYTNMSRLDVTGADASMSVRCDCGISAKLSYTYTYEHIRKGEPLLSSTRPHTATLRIGYGRKWRWYGIDAALTGRYLSPFTTDVYTEMTSYEETESMRYPGYTIWKLTCSHSLPWGTRLTLTVDNLFNYRPDYYYSNSPSTTGTALYIGMSWDLQEIFKRNR